LHEHLRYIDALQSRDPASVAEACNAHMTTARVTLMSSLRRTDPAPASVL